FYGALTDFQKKLMAIFLTNLKSYFATHELQTNQVKLSAGY
ncbi:hydroxyacid dehydrogenase, partial [Enterococcus faecium]